MYKTVLHKQGRSGASVGGSSEERPEDLGNMNAVTQEPHVWGLVRLAQLQCKKP